MRSLRDVIIGIAVFAMIISLSGLAFAEMGHGVYKGGKMDKEACAAQIKDLRDSEIVLQASSPVLAKGLSDLADKKVEMMQKCQEQKDKHDVQTKLLRDSAAVLQASNPVLAQKLWKMSEEKHMEKEEAGENMGSMGEQGEAK